MGKCPYCVNGTFENHPCEECEGTGEGSRHVELDLGDGVRASVSVRGELSERTMEALQSIGRAAHRRLMEHPVGLHVDPCACGHDHTVGREGPCGSFLCGCRKWTAPQWEGGSDDR